MGKEKSSKAKKQTRKLRDLPAKPKRAAAVKGGTIIRWSGPGDEGPEESFKR